jgi:hypothetical protein
MSKHTPGPWTIDAEESALDFEMEYWVRDATGEDICLLCSDKKTARLIAAAPDLLEALMRILPMAEDDAFQYGGKPDEDGDIVFARAAIAKATGESK